MTARRRIAFVVDRFSPTTFGGSSMQAFALARQLATTFDVEILTTTAHDYRSWANFYAPGAETVDGITVRRFPVDVERDMPRFDRRSERLMRIRRPPHDEQEQWMGEQGPLSLAFLRYLASQRDEYDAFVFVSYLYATTYFGLPLVAPRTLFLPLTHDEWVLRLSMWDRIFASPHAFAYNTEEERALTAARFPRAQTDGPVIGVGVRVPAAVDAQRFRRRFGVTRPFALYLGRIDVAKGVPALLRAYRRAGTVRDLVLIGERFLDVPARPGVHVIGPVDDEAKWDALAACDVLVQPSPFESLSLVMLEAWASGKPVIANARAAAMGGQIVRSGGGVAYRGTRNLTRALKAFDPAQGVILGTRGRAFVEANYTWPVVESRFRAHLDAAFGW